ncbi:MAG: NTP transferase domain-containing protein [Candidatus Eisenbacteria bacterium]|nr:NTP transferase domain-containing protein [Candidatus Eisenbacteria bacterium]
MRHAVILAGGWGERLWPLSTRERPKQLLPLVGDRALVRQTLERVAPLTSLETSLVLTGGTLRAPMARELPEIPGARIIGEPVGRNTAPAIALAALLLVREDPDAVLIVLPADHIVKDERAFQRTLGLACEAAEAERALVTLGIEPTRPETEYGYILKGPASSLPGVHVVERFVEKPDVATARAYLDEGGYLWNSGMFVWRADRFLEETERRLPDVARALSRVESEPGDRDFDDVLGAYYEDCPSVSVDYGVMEKASEVLVVPASFGWDDVGAWSAMPRIWEADEAGNVVRGDAVVHDASNCVVDAEDGIVGVVGVSDLVVVRTGDATLVCPKDRARDVREIVRALRERGPAGE